MNLRQELSILAGIAREMGLTRAAPYLEREAKPRAYQWDRRPTWYRFTKRFPRGEKNRAKIFWEMQAWCRHNTSGNFSCYERLATFAFEEENDAVLFQLTFDVERVEWR